MQPCIQAMAQEGFAPLQREFNAAPCTLLPSNVIHPELIAQKSRVYQAPSNAVLNENYLLKEQLGKPTYKPNAFERQTCFDERYCTVCRAKKSKVASAERVQCISTEGHEGV